MGRGYSYRVAIFNMQQHHTLARLGPKPLNLQNPKAQKFNGMTGTIIFIVAG